METIWTQADEAAIAKAAALLRAGQLVAFPTETVYGLGADALNAQAVREIFVAKGRPADNPLIVHIAQKNEIYALVQAVDERAEQLMTAFWPGPLTIILPKAPCIPEVVTAGLPAVAVRM
ncbi:MAG: L-threonylcarbamoyladenylate synthase, partial [Clostridia bacterium]